MASDKVSVELKEASSMGGGIGGNESKGIDTGVLGKVGGSLSFVSTLEAGSKTSLVEVEVAEPLLKRTIIRLKRRIEDSPSKILVVSFKRSKVDSGVEDGNDNSGGAASSGPCAASSSSDDQKTDDSTSAVYSQVLRLVGTVPGLEADNNNIAATVKNVLATSSPSIANSFRRNIKARSRRLTDKAREEFKQKSEANRFQIVNSKRGVDENIIRSEADNQKALSGAEGDAGNDLLKLLDLVPEASMGKLKERLRPKDFIPGTVTCNGLPMVKELSAGEQDDDEIGFVYDLYFTNDPGIEDYTNGQFVSVEEGEEMDFGEYRDNVEGDDDKFVDDDEDSNAEDNWRNDYPDDDFLGCEQEDNGYSGVKAFSQMGIRDDSSDDDGLIYGIDDDGRNHSLAFDESYHRFKQRFRKEYEDEVVSSASESDFEAGEEF